MPKSKRPLDDEYYSVSTSRKGSGRIKLTFPHYGTAAGMTYEVREVDVKEFLLICDHKIKIDQVGLLEDCSTVAYSNTVQQLLALKSDGHKYPPALDHVKGIAY